jgi:hypothetical protein
LKYLFYIGHQDCITTQHLVICKQRKFQPDLAPWIVDV